MREQAAFYVGQIVEHEMFGYRGVIFDVDNCYMLSDEWYEQMAKSNPPKEEPWYHVLVDNGVHSTYVAERNLRPANNLDQINHPSMGDYFETFADGRYKSFQKVN